MKIEEAHANRPECKECAGFYKGRCITLISTKWEQGRICPFFASDKRLKKDEELLKKAIKEGRVKEGKYE